MVATMGTMEENDREPNACSLIKSRIAYRDCPRKVLLDPASPPSATPGDLPTSKCIVCQSFLGGTGLPSSIAGPPLGDERPH